MRISTGLILCAGFGKRVAPLTNTTPKPLLQIKNVTLLENSINFLKKSNDSIPNVSFEIKT